VHIYNEIQQTYQNPALNKFV